MEKTRPTLVIMAAGMGSRFGGLKQITPVGPSGEKIIDYSIYDAVSAGFGKVVFVIKHAIEEAFRQNIGDRIAQHVPVEYVYQELDKLPDGYTVPEGRVKPWGTGHAVLCCRDVVKGPFAVINADDYYGRDGYRLLYDFLTRPQTGKMHIAMAGYQLENTLTENGYVSRGVCTVNPEGYLTGLVERTHIELRDGRPMFTEDDGATWEALPEHCTVSMNCWAFPAGALERFEDKFRQFLDTPDRDLTRAEFYLPYVVDCLVESGDADVQVLRTADRWYGMTYPEDRQKVIDAVHDMVSAGVYPPSLWEASRNRRLQELCAHFATEGRVASIHAYGNGHINDTYLVRCERDTAPDCRYILQRINGRVFTNIAALMANVERITAYLREKIAEQGGDPARECLTLIPTKDGKSYCLDGQGSGWRMLLFVEKTVSLETADTPKSFAHSGVAFGRFQRLLVDFPPQTLHEIIPRFHNTASRYADFERAVQQDVAGRAEEVQEEISFVRARKADTSVLVDMLERGELPLRVTHNDTKLNNVLLDERTGEPVCVIDLDTVMPGLSLYDFGDSIRFGASTAAEDETDLHKVSCSLELFEAYVRGYLSECGDSLTAQEIEMLPFAAKLITLECGMRFLTDYLQGDVYFKTSRPGQNLDRCRTQFRLVEDMESKQARMAEIVAAYAPAKCSE